MGMINNDFYTVAEVAELHECDEKSVRRWIKQGLLQAETYRRMFWIEKKTAHKFQKPKRGPRRKANNKEE